MRILFLTFYYLFSSRLPSSWWPGGKLFNKLRIFSLKRLIRIGNNVKIQKGVYIGNGNHISIGNNCQINEFTRLDNVEIGNNVMIARECISIGKMHASKSVDVPMINQGVVKVNKTIIEDDVWLGLRVVIMPGVTIKEGCIIAAGAIVTKNTEKFCVYGGVPAKLIRRRSI